MGIIKMVDEMLERRRNRKIFREFVSPELVASLLREMPKEGQLETRHFQFVVTMVNETNPKETPAIISRVVDTVFKHRAMLSDITCSLIVCLFGAPFPEGNAPEVRKGLVDALLREHGDRIRIAHGECDGPVGYLGNAKRLSYGPLIPRFAGVLKTLLETKFGTAVEIS